MVVNDREKTEVCFSSKGLGTRTRTEAKECAMWQAVDFLSNQKFPKVSTTSRVSGACQQTLVPVFQAYLKEIKKDQYVSSLNSFISKYHKDKPLPKYTEARRVSEQVFVFDVRHELFGTFTSNECKGKTSARQSAAKKAIIHLKFTQQWM